MNMEKILLAIKNHKNIVVRFLIVVTCRDRKPAMLIPKSLAAGYQRLFGR